MIRVGGATECETAIAAAAGDYPEWLMAGDFAHDTAVFAKFEDQNEWRHVRVVSGMPAVASLESQPCYAALRDADPSIPTLDIQNWGCGFYPDIRELFIGIQVAGPRLTPAAMDQGYHAIPRVLSTVPTIPTCYYDAGDYTCVKDEQVEWWDPSGQSGGSGSQPGCWRMMQAGQRYVAGNWPPGDVERQRDAKADPCNVGDTVG